MTLGRSARSGILNAVGHAGGPDGDRRGWHPGSVEHAVIRVMDEGIELEGVVLGG